MIDKFVFNLANDELYGGLVHGTNQQTSRLHQDKGFARELLLGVVGEMRRRQVNGN
jgi:hypothetical protein